MRKSLKFPHPSTRDAQKPAAPPVGDSGRPMVHMALDNAGQRFESLSLSLATRYAVDSIERNPREIKAAEHALDYNGIAGSSLSFVNSTGFPGFPTLALLGQLPEYRSMYERLADEVVRAFGEAIGGSNSDRTREINEEIEKLDIRAAVRELVIQDQQFGRSHAYFKLTNAASPAMKALPLVPRPYTVPLGSFKGLRVVEAYWTTPNFYNSNDPTADDFYKPSTWWMLGTEVHASRLHTIISRPVRDMLKPAYSFAGVSMTQMAMPYVDNWLRTRQSVSDTVKQFSVVGISMDLMQALQPGANVDLALRAELINRYRDNRNILFLDKSTEEFFSDAVPLSGLDALQAQAQEQMSAVSHIPLVVLLGITPTGLNASSDGEIRVWYDYVRGYQKAALHTLMGEVLTLIQLSKWGEVDDSIRWDWLPLHELTALELADKRYRDAQARALYIQEQVVSPAQVAEILNNDPESEFAGALENDTGVIEPAGDDVASLQQFAEQMSRAALGHAMDSAEAPAAAVAFVSNGKVLLLQRAGGGWELPTSALDQGETAEGAALRGARAATGYAHEAGLHDLGEFGALRAFTAHLEHPFEVKLEDGHEQQGWFALDELPEPLHKEADTLAAIATAHTRAREAKAGDD